jgi:hypothetical protein
MKTAIAVILGMAIGFYAATSYAQQKVYTDKNGAVVGYGNRTGNQTTYIDSTGRVIGYENRQGNTSVYTGPSGSYEGARNRFEQNSEVRDWLRGSSSQEED